MCAGGSAFQQNHATTRRFSNQHSSRTTSRQPTWLSADVKQDDDSYSLEVTYEGRTHTTSIQKGESILAALERTGTADQLSMPSLHSDCRRGNCLTCVGRHAPESSTQNLVRGEDGLTPYMSKEARKRGYILTCSSFVAGDGVKLEIGANQEAWEELYLSRLEEESTQEAGRAAVAKVIRMSAERNVEDWKEETEEVLKYSPQKRPNKRKD